MKRSIILLELLIAIGLASILMTTLFKLFVSNASIEKKLRFSQELIGERTHLLNRLETLFSNLHPPFLYTALLSDDEDFPSLIASFHAGIDPEPDFSGSNLARIHLNRFGELRLTQWPLEEALFRSEVLLREVKRVEWSFYQADQWRTQWAKGATPPPSMIRLSIWQKNLENQKEPSTQLAFILPSQETVVIE